MAKIIDLGNGYGRVEGYPSKYASLTFPLTKSQILRLYILGVLDRDEATDSLLRMGHEFVDVKWSLAVASIPWQKWRKAIERAGTI